MKYKILEDQWLDIESHRLYRIKAAEDIYPYVHVGDLGGWIEKEKNLNQSGRCWVFPACFVYEDALVCGDSLIMDESKIHGSSIVSGTSRVSRSEIYGGSMILGDITRSIVVSSIIDDKSHIVCSCISKSTITNTLTTGNISLTGCTISGCNLLGDFNLENEKLEDIIIKCDIFLK